MASKKQGSRKTSGRSSASSMAKGEQGPSRASSKKKGSTTARKNSEGDVFVRSFEPERGVAVLEFERRRERYTREKSPGQMVAMADYLRARRGFSSDQQMAEILQVHRTRLAAWKQGAELPNPHNAQLLSYVAILVNELEEFLDPDVIPDWLVTEQFTLGGATPVHALGEGQLAEVLQAANATEHGSYI